MFVYNDKKGGTMMYYYYEDAYIPKKERMEEKEKEIIHAIEYYIQKHGVSPTVREIGKMVQLKSTNTTFLYLKRLQKKKKIDWEPKRVRTIKIIPQ